MSRAIGDPVLEGDRGWPALGRRIDGTYGVIQLDAGGGAGGGAGTFATIAEGVGTVDDNPVVAIREVGQKLLRLVHTAVAGYIYVLVRPQGTGADVPSATNYTWRLGVGEGVEEAITDDLEFAIVGSEAGVALNYRYEAMI